MKRKLLIIASIITLTSFASQRANAQWTELSVPSDAGVTDALSVNGTNLFSGTAYGGFFHSSDNGTSWAEWNGVNKGLPSTSVLAIATIGTHLFAGIGGRADSGGGVFRSSDSGASWTPTGLTNTYVYALAVIGTNLFAATPTIYLSTNYGTSWSAVNNDNDVESFAVSGTNVFAGSSRGVLLSTDSGASWTKVNNGLTDSTVIALAASGTTIYASTGRDVFVSTNEGTRWTSVSSGLSDAYFVYALAASGTNVFAGTENGVFLSTSNGASWVAVGTGLPAAGAPSSHIDVYSLAANNTFLFAGIYEAQVCRRPLSEMITTSAVTEAQTVSSQFQIYPNPTTGQLHIESTSNDIVITDLLGRTCMRAMSGDGTIDVSKLPQGVYSISDGHCRSQFVKE
ncbi:MAG: T9SS type A sorting domain-containing protein [Bacteroidota bacterium]|nr:T9SS type A sorting domain-containing protein [Bacteroidota bacterium]MDP4232190.1 T9SS type A sorting domain-containing protein [Bacteroidota bacterium]MDP4243629.1 T9SS type A sorting domain-containing protein [Bacteroidota bacterium]MDP4288717.1 T9SS type A sorting domain-containing protein [Bacteroidota bacterium]